MSGFPVVESDKAAEAGNSAAAGSRLMDEESAVKSAGAVMLRPERGMNPWLARELRRGHALRSFFFFFPSESFVPLWSNRQGGKRTVRRSRSLPWAILGGVCRRSRDKNQDETEDVHFGGDGFTSSSGLETMNYEESSFVIKQRWSILF